VAKGKKDSDRRAVVEQMRREQKRKERRKSLMIIGAAVTVGAIIIGYAVWAAIQESESDGRDLASIGVAASEAGCQEVVTEKAAGNNDHRPENEDIQYDQSPPATGPHWGNFLTGTQIRKFWTTDDRPPVERLVHSLEHGHTILWYDETIADDDQAIDELRSIAGKFPSNTDFNDKFMAAPWTAEDGEPFPDGTHVALTHWSMGGTNGNPEGQLGVWQYCSQVSGEVVEQFMEDYPYSDSPEPGAA
jgi:Protein of unknown function (DUF3105)